MLRAIIWHLFCEIWVKVKKNKQSRVLDVQKRNLWEGYTKKEMVFFISAIVIQNKTTLLQGLLPWWPRRHGNVDRDHLAGGRHCALQRWDFLLDVHDHELLLMLWLLQALLCWCLKLLCKKLMPWTNPILHHARSNGLYMQGQRPAPSPWTRWGSTAGRQGALTGPASRKSTFIMSPTHL